MTIAQVSKQFQLSADTLRYYERIGLIPPVRRTSGGIRDYTEEDCRWIGFSKCMRSSGLPIEAIVEYVSLFQLGDQTVDARKQILIEQRSHLEQKIAELQQTLERLNRKIEHYEQSVLPAEKRLKKMSY